MMNVGYYGIDASLLKTEKSLGRLNHLSKVGETCQVLLHCWFFPRRKAYGSHTHASAAAEGMKTGAVVQKMESKKTNLMGAAISSFLVSVPSLPV